MHNEEIPIVDFPMKMHWNEIATTKFKTEKEAFKVDLLDYPRNNFRKKCVISSLATWNYNTVPELTPEEINKIFKEILSFKMLPNSMEGLVFTFRFKNLTHIEISHILRHRMFFSILATCSGDRDLRHDDILIPESISNSEFRSDYIKLATETKNLYAKMVDSKEVSLMDARYCLQRNNCYDYYISMNLKDAIAFVNQRKCSQVQPYSDNLIAEEVYNHIVDIIPELKDIISLKCNKSCHYTKNIERNTRLYLPDKTHKDLFEYNKKNFLYGKERHELGIPKWRQDE